MFEAQFLASLLTWGAVGTYFIAIVSQLWTNYRFKSTDGLSDFFIISYLLTYIFSVYYYFCLDLSLPYKILEPVSFGLVLVMIYQRLYYSSALHRKTLYTPLALCTIIGAFFLVWSQVDIVAAGHCAGWLAFIFDTVTPIPQIYQISRTKSVEGLSFIFTSCIALANTAEFFASIVSELPPQTVFMGIKSIIFYIIFVFQFMLYKNNTYTLHDQNNN